MQEWSNYFVATAGAAAALTGLIFVGVSISLAKILSIPKLPNRALQSLILLLAILIVSSLCLVPGQSSSAIGKEVLLIGVIVWLMIAKTDIDTFRQTRQQYKKQYLLNILVNQLAIIPYILSGIFAMSNGYNGIYWIVPAFLFSFMKSLIDAWVLLIEIHR